MVIVGFGQNRCCDKRGVQTRSRGFGVRRVRAFGRAGDFETTLLPNPDRDKLDQI
jgi:hypothetical protein